MVREEFTPISVIGSISINGIHECYTLEPTEFLIPVGNYPVFIYHSPRFKMLLPLIAKVPNRNFIEIHRGNKPQESKGCILVGQTKESNSIGRSKLAFNSLMSKLKSIGSEPISIEITEVRNG
jgi:hypothetical protein